MQGKKGKEGIKDNSGFELGRPDSRAEEEEFENTPAVRVPMLECVVNGWTQGTRPEVETRRWVWG